MLSGKGQRLPANGLISSRYENQSAYKYDGSVIFHPALSVDIQGGLL